MRWGVRDEVTDAHETTELCVKEIRTCQQLSAGPNFIVSVYSIAACRVTAGRWPPKPLPCLIVVPNASMPFQAFTSMLSLHNCFGFPLSRFASLGVPYCTIFLIHFLESILARLFFFLIPTYCFSICLPKSRAHLGAKQCTYVLHLLLCLSLSLFLAIILDRLGLALLSPVC